MLETLAFKRKQPISKADSRCIEDRKEGATFKTRFSRRTVNIEAKDSIATGDFLKKPDYDFIGQMYVERRLRACE